MASSPSLPPVESLRAADDATLKSVLDTLFEPVPELHALAVPSIRDEISKYRDSASSSSSEFTYTKLIQHVDALLSSLLTPSGPPASSSPPDPTLYAILGSHPRLGEKNVTSAQSRAEQAQLQHPTDDRAAATTPLAAAAAAAGGGAGGGGRDEGAGEAEADVLAALNAEYETRFPGLRYVVFVNGRGRPAVFADMRARIARGDAAAEEREAVRAMVDIALDRAAKLGRGSASLPPPPPPPPS